MALDIQNGKIRVYNYEKSPCGFPSQYNQNGVFFNGRNEEEEYVVERVHWDDIEAENTKSDLFKIGRLRFNPEEEDEIYTKLGIDDRSNIVSDKELVEILKDDSIENIKRISNIRSLNLLSRMKKVLFSMERNGNTPPHNVTSIVNERNFELKYGGKRNENSVINKMLEADKKKNDENKLKEQVSELSKIVEKLQKESEEKDKTIKESTSAIQDLLKMVNDLKVQPVQEEVKEEQKTTPQRKTGGRPKKTE